MKLPGGNYFRVTLRWFLTASIGTILLSLLGRFLPEGLWRLIVTLFFWPANLVLFLSGPFDLGVGPKSAGYHMAFSAIYFLGAVPINGAGWGCVGFLQALSRDVLQEGFRAHKKRVITVAVILAITMGLVGIRLPSVLNPLPKISTALGTCKTIQTGFMYYTAGQTVTGFPAHISSWDELVDFLDTCCAFDLNKKAEDARLEFISYRALKRPRADAEFNSGYVIYFSIYKPPDNYARKFVEVTAYAVQQLTAEEYALFPQIRDALARYAKTSPDGRFPGRIDDWAALVSICGANGTDLTQAGGEQSYRLVSYEEKSDHYGSYYILRLETDFPFRETREIRPF